jgi:hypothetical protein
MAKESIAELKRLLEQTQRPLDRPVELVSTGCPALDRCLPEGGLRRGSLVEWLGTGPGCGVDLFALQAARQAIGAQRFWVVLDRQQTFYPPAAAAWGLDVRRLILVRTSHASDEQWALDQALRCPQVGAVLAWPTRLDDRAFRRLQLAAESGGSLGILVRPEQARSELSWADVRFRVAACGEPSEMAASVTDPDEAFAHVPRHPASFQQGSAIAGTGKALLPRAKNRPTAGPSPHLTSVSPDHSTCSVEPEQAAACPVVHRTFVTRQTAAQPARPNRIPASGTLHAAARAVWRWQVELLRCRGHWSPTHIALEIDLWTGALYETVSGDLAASVAHPASAAHSARA